MDYLELNPESATLMDLLQLLYSCDNVQKINHCVRCKDHEKLRVFRHRWVIFMSIVTLKCIRGFASLMVKVGDIVELWLNLVPCNGGFKQLFFNFLRVASLVEFQVVFKPIEVIWGYEQVTTPFSGEVIMPISSHASFVTFIGHLDPRVELDKNILPNDYRYSASLSAMASKLSYENESFVKDVITNHWKMGFLGFYEFWNSKN